MGFWIHFKKFIGNFVLICYMFSHLKKIRNQILVKECIQNSDFRNGRPIQRSVSLHLYICIKSHLAHRSGFDYSYKYIEATGKDLNSQCSKTGCFKFIVINIFGLKIYTIPFRRKFALNKVWIQLWILQEELRKRRVSKIPYPVELR